MAQSNWRGGRGRRTKNEINMVPFIDVMLVLLIIFMVSAPLMPTGVVDLPSVGKAKQAPEKVIEVVVGEGEQVSLRIDQQDSGSMKLAELTQRVKAAQDSTAGGPTAAPVIISARKDVRYDAVLKIMDTLQRAGVARVGLTVHTTGG
ncbi:biopolymer transporter ExbD [Aquabacterium sp.]|uniref:biopolymer transporter ExbD n=1 Tax=Aquabacterium sp. TaxID=1872578 RepID=UPI00198B32AA|nr:biopolymer transporter ExbD [Aquabacterium sp.]MBC7698932.1 biopolymer transporter ExbD [Aquabacterium sp.]